MTVIEVWYPFEVDEERGLTMLLYPSIRSALADASDLYTRQAEAEEEYEDSSTRRNSQRPAKVCRSTVAKLTVGRFCAIINSNGEGWCQQSEDIGTITWNGKRARYIKAKE